MSAPESSSTEIRITGFNNGNAMALPAPSDGLARYTRRVITVKTATKVKKATLYSVKSSKKTRIYVTWKTVSGASGYELQYSTSKKFTSKTTKKTTFKKSTTKKTTLKKLKSKKKYYIRIRAYKTVNGKKVYGSYSSVKSVTVK